MKKIVSLVLSLAMVAAFIPSGLFTIKASAATEYTEGYYKYTVTDGKAEREKFEKIKGNVSKQLQDVYEQTDTLHDGKWLWIPLDGKLQIEDVIEMLKIKRRPNRK